MKRITLPLILFLALLAAVNAALLFLSRSTQRGVLLSALRRPSDANILIVGNSLMNAGIDPQTLESGQSRGLRTFDATLGQSSPIDHALIAREALAHQPEVKWLVYGYFDDQLNHDPSLAAAELSGNRAFVFYFPSDAADLMQHPDPWTRARLHLFGALPMLRERSALWMKVEKVRRQLSEVGMPKHETNRFGRAEDFAALDTPVEDFIPRARAVLESDSGLFKPTRAILATAKEHGVRVVIVEMPMRSTHRQGLYATPEWKALREANMQWLADAGATYVTATEWIADSGFNDPVHMSPEGAREFSAKLLDTLAELGAGQPQR